MVSSSYSCLDSHSLEESLLCGVITNDDFVAWMTAFLMLNVDTGIY